MSPAITAGSVRITQAMAKHRLMGARPPASETTLSTDGKSWA